MSKHTELEEREEYFEWGYRLADGREFWQQDIDTGGSRISQGADECDIPDIDIHDGPPAEKIRDSLFEAGADAAVVLRRKVCVTRGPVEDADHECIPYAWACDAWICVHGHWHEGAEVLKAINEADAHLASYRENGFGWRIGAAIRALERAHELEYR